nr:hypothetical protein TetV2_00389 [Oceanusvirus sp.]
MASSRVCKACATELPIEKFELSNGGTSRRWQCGPCRYSARCKSAKSRNVTAVRKPCAVCDLEYPDVKFEVRADTGAFRSVCSSCEYWQNRDVLLERNKRYREENPEKIREHMRGLHLRRRTQATTKLASVKDTARSKNIDFGLPDEVAIDLFHGPCFGCGHWPENEGDELNSIDRVDNKRGYEMDNVAAACKHCNVAKGDIPLDVFFHKVQMIARKQQLPPPAERREYKRTFSHPGSANPEKSKVVKIGDDKIIELCCSPCHLCGHGPSGGIDRFDNDVEYTEENSRPCCTYCNYMRKDLSVDDFLYLVSMVAHRHGNRPVAKPEELPMPQIRGIDRKLTKIIGPGGKKVVFPSVYIYCGYTNEGGRRIKIPGGVPANALEYWTQDTDASVAREAFSLVCTK